MTLVLTFTIPKKNFFLMSYNTDKYLKIISDAILAGTVSGSSNIASLAGHAVDTKDGDKTTGTLRVTIADNDTNLIKLSNAVTSSKFQCEITNEPTVAIDGTVNVSGTVVANNQMFTDLDDCIDTTNHVVAQNLQQITGYTVEVGPGSVSGPLESIIGVQRVCIADNDTNLSQMNTKLGTLSGGITSSKYQCEITNTPSVTVSSAVVSGTVAVSSVAGTVGVSGSVSLTGSTNNVNVVNIGGVAAQVGTGTMANSLRVNMATDDTIHLNILNSLYDHRYLTTKYWCHMLGGTISQGQLLSSKWCCIPNDSSCTWDETNTEPVVYNDNWLYNFDNGDDDGSNNGAVYYYVTFTDNNSTSGGSTTATTLVSIGGSYLATLLHLWSIERIVFSTSSTNTANTGNIWFTNNSTSKGWAYCPAGKGICSLFNIVMPAGNNRFFLDKLTCQSLDFTNTNRGFRIKIEMWVSLVSTNAVLFKYNIFETQVNSLQQTIFDLSDCNTTATWSSYSNSSLAFKYSLHLFVKGGNYGDGNTSPTSCSCYLSVKGLKS